MIWCGELEGKQSGHRSATSRDSATGTAPGSLSGARSKMSGSRTAIGGTRPGSEISLPLGGFEISGSIGSEIDRLKDLGPRITCLRSGT